MRTEYEYADGMLGGYNPNSCCGKQSRNDQFRDTQHRTGRSHLNQEMPLEKVFHVTSVFPMDATATPTIKAALAH